MYRNTCSPFQATGVLFRHPKAILTGDGSLLSAKMLSVEVKGVK
ncbi:hypothetical protein [Xenorhabdus littoralis]|nr:hypothetical protein [Xenorhabdus sp. psl]